MPKNWYNRINIGALIKNGASDEEIAWADYLNSICAYRKPYFMNYIYLQQKSKYDNYIKRANEKCAQTFKISLDTLMSKENKTEKERSFLAHFKEFLPSSDGDCVMNRLCHAVEKHFDGYVSEIKANGGFDYSIMKSWITYGKTNYAQIRQLYIEYNNELAKFMKFAKENHIDDNDQSLQIRRLIKAYKEKCVMRCPDSEELCNIVLDLCYTNNKSKQFAWDMCGEQIIENLLQKNDRIINYLTANDNGDIEYCGRLFKAAQKRLEEYDGIDNE